MPDVGDLVQARIVQTISGQPVINDLSFSLVAPFATWTEAANQLAADMDAAIGVITGGGVWDDVRSSNWSTQALQVVDVYPGVAPLLQFASGSVGTGGSNVMPPNDCLAVTLRSDFRGASGRGRIYLGGWDSANFENGYWEAAAQDAASALMSALNDAFGELAGAANFRWAVLHKMAGGVPVVPPEVKPVMSFTIHNEGRSLSRRAMGRRISRRTVGP